MSVMFSDPQGDPEGRGREAPQEHVGSLKVAPLQPRNRLVLDDEQVPAL